MLDVWTAEARDLYERRQAPEIRRAADSIGVLTADQRHALALLLAPISDGAHTPDAERAAVA